jgi:hypothetical protein
MKSINIPGAFWVALVGAVVPAITVVLQQYFPEAQYWWTALAVALLAAVAKAVQVYAGAGSQAQPPAPPAATARGAAVDGDDYTYERAQGPSKAMRVLFG